MWYAAHHFVAWVSSVYRMSHYFIPQTHQQVSMISSDFMGGGCSHGDVVYIPKTAMWSIAIAAIFMRVLPEIAMNGREYACVMVIGGPSLATRSGSAKRFM